jgi:TATA-box binding protein (TBP) (component of TFIID and TFIIIB)
MSDLIVENLVITAHINQELPLQSMAINIPNTSYDEQEPVLIFRFDEPKRAVLITKKGFMTCTGCTSFQEGEETITDVINIINEHGITIDDLPDCEIQSFVLSKDMNMTLDLDYISKQLASDKIRYVPDQQPWIEYMYDDNISILINASGKIICTGNTSLDEGKESIDAVSNILESI